MVNALPIALSTTALIFSVYVFFNSRVRDRRDVLIKMSEMFISDDLEKGRYLLFNKVTDKASVDHLDDQEYHNINRALSAFNLLGLYVKNGYIGEKDAIETWGSDLRKVSLRPEVTVRISLYNVLNDRSTGYVRCCRCHPGRHARPA